MIKIKPRLMILKGGADAIHMLGNIKRDFDDKIIVYEEDEDNYYGNFEEGFGFINVKFKKEDVRCLTKEEIDKINRTYYSINGNVLFKNKYDYDGYFIQT